jgi:hypothetical protein
MSNIVKLDTNNFDSMAEAMGLATTVGTTESARSSTLSRLRIWHKSIMGTEEVKGKTRQVEVVPGGTYRLEDRDGNFLYAEKISFRPFLQQFSYTRYIPYMKPDDQGRKGRFLKSVMVGQSQFGRDDLMDTDGGFNCGRPSGYIKNWGELPDAKQKLIMSVKRVRSLLGIVEMEGALDSDGEPVTVDPTPVIWDIDNKDAFREIGKGLDKYVSNRRLLPQHKLELTTLGEAMPNGNMIYCPVVDIDFQKTLPISEDDQKMFSDFKDWVRNQNVWVRDRHNSKAITTLTTEDEDTITGFIDVSDNVEVA